MEIMKDNHSISIQVVANTLGIALDAAIELAKHDGFPATRVNGHWIVEKDAFLDWITKEAMSLND